MCVLSIGRKLRKISWLLRCIIGFLFSVAVQLLAGLHHCVSLHNYRSSFKQIALVRDGTYRDSSMAHVDPATPPPITRYPSSLFVSIGLFWYGTVLPARCVGYVSTQQVVTTAACLEPESKQGTRGARVIEVQQKHRRVPPLCRVSEGAVLRSAAGAEICRLVDGAFSNQAALPREPNTVITFLKNVFFL